MAIDKNRMKTSLFLALLMILTPFATASTVTTFSDGSSEVVIEFKDGYSLENNSDGGFILGSGETITSATVNISSSPMKHHSISRLLGNKSRLTGIVAPITAIHPSIMLVSLSSTKTQSKIRFNSLLSHF